MVHVMALSQNDGMPNPTHTWTSFLLCHDNLHQAVLVGKLESQ